jgi:hypothetical protein
MTVKLMGALMGAISRKNHPKRGKEVLNLRMEAMASREILDTKGYRDNPAKLRDIPFTPATGVQIPLGTPAILRV